MIEESKIFKHSVLWFTTLVGKKINLDKLYKELIDDKEINQVKSTTFYQGKLARWGLAWSFYNPDEMISICDVNDSINAPKISSKNNFSSNKSISNAMTRIRLTHTKNKNKHVNKSFGEL